MSDSGKVRSYQDLEVWQLAVTVAERCYQLTKSFPRDELYGMTSQIRRSAVSIAANIAEGYGRDQTGNFLQFLRIAQGSTRELETHVIIARRVSLVEVTAADDLLKTCERISKMLRSLFRAIEQRPYKSSPPEPT